jgi:DNA mismatch repair protein MutL
VEKTLDLSPFEDIPETLVQSPAAEAIFTPGEHVPMYQYKGSYILVPVKSGLMWVHQRRAHIRVLFEKYRSQMQARQAASQGLLFPERIEATVKESVVIEAISEELASLGFDISSLGGGTYVLNGVPAELDGLSPVKLLMDVVHGVMDQTNEAQEKLYDRIALSMAKEVAIIVGQMLSQDEITSLVDNLFATSMPARTPDGAAITYIMGDNEIDRNFGR